MVTSGAGAGLTSTTVEIFAVRDRFTGWGGTLPPTYSGGIYIIYEASKRGLVAEEVV